MDISNQKWVSYHALEPLILLPSLPPPWSPPDALSIFGIARRYCRERILVRPLRWASRHLELLRISFGEPSLAPSTSLSDHYSKCVEIHHLMSYSEKFQTPYSREHFYFFDDVFCWREYTRSCHLGSCLLFRIILMQTCLLVNIAGFIATFF